MHTFSIVTTLAVSVAFISAQTSITNNNGTAALPNPTPGRVNATTTALGEKPTWESSNCTVAINPTPGQVNATTTALGEKPTWEVTNCTSDVNPTPGQINATATYSPIPTNATESPIPTNASFGAQVGALSGAASAFVGAKTLMGLMAIPVALYFGL